MLYRFRHCLPFILLLYRFHFYLSEYGVEINRNRDFVNNNFFIKFAGTCYDIVIYENAGAYDSNRTLNYFLSDPEK